MSPAAEEYKTRLESLQKAEKDHRKRDRVFIAVKILAGVCGVGLAVWLARYHAGLIYWLFVPVVLLLLLFALHERVLRAIRSNAQLREAYKLGLARLDGSWKDAAGAGAVVTGERFLAGEGAAAQHPYARDLDLFGRGSVYHLLCTAHTRVGQDTLAHWLLVPAEVAEIQQRQEAVRELAGKLDFRERLVLAGVALAERSRRSGGGAEALAEWSEARTGLDPRLRLPGFALALVWAASLVLWRMYGYGWFALLMSLVNLAFAYAVREQVRQSGAAIEAATGGLEVLAGVMGVIEQERFSSAKLVLLQQRLQLSGVFPSQAIARLRSRCDWLFSADNVIVKVFDRFVFWTIQCIFLVEDWRHVHGSFVREWLSAVGEIEALSALSTYAYEHPTDAFPTFTEGGVRFEAEDFSHPLLPSEGTVRNTLKLDKTLRLIVISGPNMAGKSTFIRSVGVNAVLAQAGAPVRARRMEMTPLAVAASICILDSLQGGLSRFYAEILRLKQVDALSREEMPVLFLLDELLSGTNSHDRRIGTESVVRSLVSRGAIGLVTTHDLALAEIALHMEAAANFHFEDRYEDGQLYFEYKLTPGIVQTSNALQLMRSIGLEV